MRAPRLVLPVSFSSKDALKIASEYLTATLPFFKRRDQANGGTTLLSSNGDVALLLHATASTLFELLQQRGPRVTSLIISNRDDEDMDPLPPSRSIFSSFSTRLHSDALVSNKFTGAGAASTSSREVPRFFVKEISVPCSTSDTYHNEITARNAFSAAGGHLPGIYRNEQSLCHIRLIPSSLFALTLRVDSIHSFNSSAMNKLGGDQYELVNPMSLPFSLRVTECDDILPWHVEGKEAVLEGTEPKLQSKRVMSTTDDHIHDARMNQGNCWEEVRVIAKQPQKLIGTIRSEIFSRER